MQETTGVAAGEIDVVMGGPPCQGVSGLNRHSATENILKDGRYFPHITVLLLLAIDFSTWVSGSHPMLHGASAIALTLL